MNCRHCNQPLTLKLIDLGSAPPSNAYLNEERLRSPEVWYPLRVMVCQECWLVQTQDFARPEELFHDEYAYFSSISSTWLVHAQHYVQQMTDRFDLDEKSLVIELGSNDGYLLQYVKERGIPALGIEPTAVVARAAREKGIEVREKFFDSQLATELVAEGFQADLVVANNVLAHVPDINDFSAGVTKLLKPKGVATFEFPHLLNLFLHNQFDTIYHEHFSYLSMYTVKRIFESVGLQVFDLQELPTHGGSLRVFAQVHRHSPHKVTGAVERVIHREVNLGMTQPGFYQGMEQRCLELKHRFLEFLLEARRLKKTVAAYGAAAKGNTFLNFAGVRPDLLSYVADRNPVKQGLYMPGSRIPIVNEEHLREKRPDYVVILPWNLTTEIMEQLAYVRSWNGRFVTALPGFTIH